MDVTNEQLIQNAIKLFLGKKIPAIEALLMTSDDSKVRLALISNFKKAIDKLNTSTTDENYQLLILEKMLTLEPKARDVRVSNDTIAVKRIKYETGKFYHIVTDMGLQSTAQGASCPYQFSRKTKRPGVMDLAVDTPVKYVGIKEVYSGKSSSKRMIFVVSSGTSVTVDGESHSLDHDIEVAGVANHIDQSVDYNVRLKLNKK